MELARVCGNVVASARDGGLGSHRLLLLDRVPAADPGGQADGGSGGSAAYVAIDLVGAGVGEVVLVTRGSAARVASGTHAVPTDVAVIAIVDTVHFDGRATFVKR